MLRFQHTTSQKARNAIVGHCMAHFLWEQEATERGDEILISEEHPWPCRSQIDVQLHRMQRLVVLT